MEDLGREGGGGGGWLLLLSDVRGGRMDVGDVGSGLKGGGGGAEVDLGGAACVLNGAWYVVGAFPLRPTFLLMLSKGANGFSINLSL